MKKLFVVVAITLFASPALADQPKAKFYDFGDQVINGEIKTPTVQLFQEKKKVEFDRHLSLKKSFISEIEKTSNERTFK